MTETLAPTAAPTLALDEPKWLAPVYNLPRLEIVSGHGCRVQDAGGREYLDFTSGIAVNALGHAPRGLARVVARQMSQLGHCSNLFANRPAAELARVLCEATEYNQVFFCNSGAEGIESALKFTRARARALGLPGRDIVAFRGGFHGRTGFALSATWTPSYREPFEPLVPGIRFADYNSLPDLDHVLDSGVAAILVEPVQGESGAVPATREFLQGLRQRADRLRAALVIDEVQSGMGRCGRLLAAEHFGVRGDLTVMSKALGGGLPLGAVLMMKETADALSPGMHGCTFGGGAIAATAALWTLEKVNRKPFLARVRRRAARLARGLQSLAKRHPIVRQTRGLGLLTAIELEAGYEPPKLIAAARENGLLLVRGGEQAVRLLPPLVVSQAEIDEALTRLDGALTQLESDKEASR